jgi:DNA-binding transcriptional regulator YhcF (GntR family)
MEESLQGRVDRAGGVPLGTQLVERIRAAVAGGRLNGGDRLPSVRELADSAGVNVNTVRAAYARLESEGLVRSEHGRGTFVAGASPPSRAELRDQITALEATLARLPPPPLAAAEQRPARAALLSTDELVEVRDRLLELGFEAPTPAMPSRRATTSLAGARVRWVGA